MPEYFVMHPNLNRSAVVEAPTTEKARTTFLDHLERHRVIGRRARQQYREDMVAERLEDAGAVDADVRLSYYYNGQEPEGSVSLGDLPRESQYYDEPEMMPEPEPVEAYEPARSPIAEVSLGGYEYDREEE